MYGREYLKSFRLDCIKDGMSEPLYFSEEVDIVLDKMEQRIHELEERNKNN